MSDGLQPPPARVPGSSGSTSRIESGGTTGSFARVGSRYAPIPRRPRVGPWLQIAFATVFAIVVLPVITADRWLAPHGVLGDVAAPITLRTAPFAHDGAGILVARGAVPTGDEAASVNRLLELRATGPLPYALYFGLVLALALITSHHLARSLRGRLLRVQVVSFVSIAALAIAAKVLLLLSTASVLVMPVAAFALVPTLTLDRITGLASGVLAALAVALVGPFDVGVAILLLVQVSVAGLVVAEGPKHRTRHALWAGTCATVATALTYALYLYLGLGRAPLAELSDPLHSPWVAATLGPALGTLLAIAAAPLYQLAVGEITQGRLIELEDLSNPMLKQIAERAPGTWQHSLMMANMAEIAANAIGASGRLVRVGAYYHDLGKSLTPKYFIENLEPGETSPHDNLPPEVSCDAIFAHVVDGIAAARRAGLHERVIDFMHMHHGNGVLEYFWARCQEQGNPHALSIEQFRYPGHPPQTRETAILAICDAVEAASRTLKKADAQAIDSLVQRIVYGKLHLGQLDESGLSMGDLRRVADSLRDTIKHANHGRIEYPWQRAEAAAATTTDPRLDSLDRKQQQTDPLAVTAPQVTRTVNERPPVERQASGEQPIVKRPSGEQPIVKRPSGEQPIVKRPSGEQPVVEPIVDRPSERISARRLAAASPGESFERKITQPFARKVEKPTQPFDRGERKAEGPTQPFQRKPTGGLEAIVPPADVDGPPPEVLPPDQAAHAEIEAMNAPLVAPAAPLPIAPMNTQAVEEAMVEASEPVIELGQRKQPSQPPTSRAPTLPPPPRRTNPFAETADVTDPDGAPMTLDALDPRSAAFAPPSGEVTNPGIALMSADVTNPGMPSVFCEVTRPGIAAPPPDWAKRLAARVDAEMSVSDDTVERSVDEIASERALAAGDRRRADPTHELSSSDLMSLARPSKPPPRNMMPTHEVDPDDIEAAIEVAPPARRPATSIGVAKKKTDGSM